MKLNVNQGNLDQYLEKLTEAVSECVDEGVEAAKQAVHVLTGRNRESIRQIEPETDSNGITLRLQVGGVAIPGVEFEQGIVAPVDYSLEEETRHPLIVPFAVPAILEAVENLRIS